MKVKMNDSVKTLLGSIGKNNSDIKALLKEKSRKVNEVQIIMDKKARTKTPLNERQQQTIHELTGVYAKEGGLVRQSLMSMEHTIKNNFEKYVTIHTENTEVFLHTLSVFHKHQSSAIHSLRRMIAVSEETLALL